MAPHHRRRIIPSRRRAEDDGEEGSIEGEFEDDSLSEGTATTNLDEDEDADVEGSDSSDHETTASMDLGRGKGQAGAGKEKRQQGGKSTSTVKIPFSVQMSDTEAMLNGMKLSEEVNGMSEINFDDMNADLHCGQARTQSVDRKTHRRETFAERKRREHEEYLKERDSNPAFVPTRGGFFLHDKRNTDSPSNGYRQNNKAKSRPHGLIVDSNVARRPPQKSDVTEGQWVHDLHETVAQDPPAPVTSSPHNHLSTGVSKPVPTAPRSAPPNRSFSSTVLIGNVPVIVFLPGMANPIPFSAVPKRQHTRLPQHRPPLRRDKPVRISIPGSPPRYIFPATERSFIFIPRALRPNQAYRARGRGGFYNSRRTSVYGGSVYTPSVAMSRRSSFGRAVSGEGIISPAGSVISRGGMMAEGGKPVVRLPPSIRPPGPGGPVPAPNVFPNMPPPIAPGFPQPPPYAMPPPPTMRENRPSAAIPMHQPRPQKAVSIADIESPVTFAPKPQQEQPFHHQVPQPVNGHGPMGEPSMYPPQPRHISHPSQASMPSPLSQIPERAIHAQPFQPYQYPPPQPYYGASGYLQPPAFYPMTTAEYPAYTTPGPPGPPPGPAPVPAPAAAYSPAGQPVPYGAPPQQGPPEQASQTGTVAHESNGTVYYYDSSQFQNGAYPTPPQGGVVGMGGMITPPGAAYYYPQQPPNGTVYYT
ncbi:hypothetical protein AJ80_07436 [Polytolypa hystricis UAMH7299]|uniref:Btz domain-containing protein n=1 Tax=Polytolypa hystricis (strain UAMH7299) TaxID=1447883 RepID=A0A2B7XP21_POLH7|nr:hypothetical protein AJ80_07436 [Polytolypa hystricis UAMH7299]